MRPFFSAVYRDVAYLLSRVCACDFTCEIECRRTVAGSLGAYVGVDVNAGFGDR